MLLVSTTRLLGRGRTLLRYPFKRICINMSSSSTSGKRLRVLVDMDGVLADFEGGFLKKYRARYPEEPYITLEDRRGFWVSAQYEQLRSDLCAKAISIWESKDFFIDLEPLPGGVEAVKEMAKMDDTDVFICTSPIKNYRHCPHEKYAWVEKHLGYDFLEQVILTRDKTLVTGDLLIDDKPDILGVNIVVKAVGCEAVETERLKGPIRGPLETLKTFAPSGTCSNFTKWKTTNCFYLAKLSSIFILSIFVDVF